jgi:RNA polymerase sigma factor (sigma-70 family)
MDEKKVLAQEFEKARSRLSAVAFRMLGSASEAEDALQESWLRASRADTSGVENLGGWFTTVVARVCLDLLRVRKSRREEPEDVHAPDGVAKDAASDPEHDVLLADSVGLALLVVLELLQPAERLAFVLHDMFDVSFDEIAPIVGCSSTAARQLASRARRRVRGTSLAETDPDIGTQRDVVNAFLTASRDGDLSGLLALLAPNVVLRADRVAQEASAVQERLGAPKLSREVHGPAAVADAFLGRARAAQAALIDGFVGAVWAPGGVTRVAFEFTVLEGKVVDIYVNADPHRVKALDVSIFGR